VPQNGEINEKFGTYKSVCCDAEIIINPGVPFPDCPRHVKLPTIWKRVSGDKLVDAAPKKSDVVPFVEVHVENRRLFQVAAGTLSLEPWERDHLHVCSVCQGVLYVFLRQPIVKSSENPAA
jgi:hypothetical protein